MTKTLFLISLLTVSNFASANDQLSQKMLNKQFSPTVIKKNAIKGDILTGYQYKDSVGKHVLLLTGNSIKCADEVSDLTACYDKLYAYSFIIGKKLKKEWSLYDFINKTEVSDEYSIEFMHDKITLKDLDGDGRIEPTLVYNTLGLNKLDDGRIKILTYYKGRKRAVRHQNDTLDYGRGTTVEKSFYSMPKSVKNHVIGIMQALEDKETAIFAWGWKESMQKGKTKIVDKKQVYSKASFKTAEAEVKGFKLIGQQQAKLTLDFVNIFGNSREEYERYSKTGYPKMTWNEFQEEGPGGIFIMNNNKKLRELTTNADTIYQAHCTDSPHADDDGLVSLNLSEFSAILDRKYGNGAAQSVVHNKHGHCYSQNGSLLSIKYAGKVLKHVIFVWTP